VLEAVWWSRSFDTTEEKRNLCRDLFPKKK
jgi:hypothetical protein